MSRPVGKAGLELIKRMEGCRLAAYQDVAGVWTVGYGHTAGVKRGQKITQAQAEAFLLADCQSAANAVDKLKRDFNDNQRDALISFAFNLGANNLIKVTVGNRSCSAIANAMLLYCKAGGKRNDGLVARRKEEVKLFNTPCGPSAPSQTAPAHTSTTQQYSHKVGEVVTYSTCYNSSADPNSKAINCNPWRSGTITKIKTGAKNPYLIENGRCWINDGDIRSTGSVQQTSQTASAVYVVKKGDTLTKIAKAHGTTVNTIKKLNGIKDANKIVVGQKIKL